MKETTDNEVLVQECPSCGWITVWVLGLQDLEFMVLDLGLRGFMFTANCPIPAGFAWVRRVEVQDEGVWSEAFARAPAPANLGSLSGTSRFFPFLGCLRHAWHEAAVPELAHAQNVTRMF